MRLIAALKFLIVSLALAACVGTGTKNYSKVNAVTSSGIATLPSGGGQALILREEAWVGGGALISVYLNGDKIGELGNGEVIIEPVEVGQNIINAKVEGLQGIGLNTATYNFANGGENNSFFIIGFKTGLMKNELTITETVESSWKRAQD